MFPEERAAKIATKAVREFIESNPEALDQVIFVTFSEKSYNIYKEILDNYN